MKNLLTKVLKMNTNKENLKEQEAKLLERKDKLNKQEDTIVETIITKINELSEVVNTLNNNKVYEAINKVFNTNLTANVVIDNSKELNDLKQKLDKANKDLKDGMLEVVRLHRVISQNEQSLSDLEKQYKTEITNLKVELDKTTTELNNNKSELAKTKQELDTVKAELVSAKKVVVNNNVSNKKQNKKEEDKIKVETIEVVETKEPVNVLSKEISNDMGFKKITNFRRLVVGKSTTSGELYECAECYFFFSKGALETTILPKEGIAMTEELRNKVNAIIKNSFKVDETKRVRVSPIVIEERLGGYDCYFARVKAAEGLEVNSDKDTFSGYIKIQDKYILFTYSPKNDAPLITDFEKQLTEDHFNKCTVNVNNNYSGAYVSNLNKYIVTLYGEYKKRLGAKEEAKQKAAEVNKSNNTDLKSRFKNRQANKAARMAKASSANTSATQVNDSKNCNSECTVESNNINSDVIMDSSARTASDMFGI